MGDLNDVFGILGKQMRPSQVKMMQKIYDAIKNKCPAIIEAPTGTGKSLGNVLPAAMYAVASNTTVIITTKTKSLQDQYAAEMPDIAAALNTILPRPLVWAVLKGRGAFTCQAVLSDPDTKVPDSLKLWIKDGGERREDAPVHTDREWSDVSVGLGECTGSKCPFAETCLAQQQRLAAFKADLVITNHKLLAIQLANPSAPIIPDHTVTIIDESHEFPEVLNEELGRNITTHSIKNVDEAAGIMFANMLPQEGTVTLETIEQPLRGALENVLKLINGNIAHLQQVIEDALQQSMPISKYLRALKKRERLRDRIYKVLNPEDDEIMWFDVDGLHLRKIHVEPFIAATLGDRPTIFTSATICGQKYGLRGTPITSVGGGFRNAKLYIPEHISDPSVTSYSWRLDAAEESLALIQAMGGRTLLLYTSYAAMDNAVKWLRPRLNVPLFTQKDPHAVDSFAEDEVSCLAGVASLWTGINVPGRALSMVIIDRIPFKPNSPLSAAKKRSVQAITGSSYTAFTQVDLPPARIMLAQGAGRLLRGPEDKGIIAILDPRLHTKAYRDDISFDLTRYERVSEKDKILRYAREIRG